jgi:hypothetical protein
LGLLLASADRFEIYSGLTVKLGCSIAHLCREGWGVASILPFIRKAGTVFDDRVTELIGEAFDAACKDLHDKGQPAIVYEVIANRIIDAAKNGERDRLRLRNIGLAGLGFDSGKQAG